MLKIEDVRDVDCTGYDLVVYDPPFDADWAWDYMPAFEGNNMIAFCGCTHIQKLVMAATQNGWTLQYQFILDTIQSWLRGPNKPLSNYRSAILLSDDHRFYYKDAVTKITEKGDKYYLRNVERWSISRRRPCKYYKPVFWINAMIGGISRRCNTCVDMFAGSGVVEYVCDKFGIACDSYDIEDFTSQSKEFIDMEYRQAMKC
jgi:hypothetical protein